MHSDLSRHSVTSPTSVPLPASPQDTQSEFDALIELLATDEPGSALNVNLKAQNGHTDLKDEDGRLDFAKIRTLFASSSNGPRSSTSWRSVQSENVTGRATAPSQSGMSHAGSSSLKFKSPQAGIDNVSTPGSPLRASAISTLVLSPSSPVSNFNSSAFEAGLPPDVPESTPLVKTRALQGGNVAESSAGPPWRMSSEQQQEVPLELNDESSSQDMQRDSQGLTPSLSILKHALGLAQKEVAGLRERCRELEDLVRPAKDASSRENDLASEEPESRDLLASRSVSERNDRSPIPQSSVGDMAPDFEHSGASDGNKADDLLEIDALSSTQARFAIKSLLRCLALPSSHLPVSATSDAAHPIVPPSSIDDIHRALDMVKFVDELVWKRSRFGAQYDNPYGRDNVQALRERLELWERVVRTRR